MLRVKAPTIVSKKELIDWLYADAQDGGPLFAETIITLTVHSLRKDGFRITNHWGRGYSMTTRVA
jgi:DNA-binding response OmpR family regulator